VPIAARIGLITMVFTHLPSNILLILILFAPIRDRDRPLAGAQRAVANGCADAQPYVMAVVTPRSARRRRASPRCP
jgi:hypothetical protein